MSTSRIRTSFVFLLTAFILAAAWFNPATTRARTEVQAGFERALTVFAVARTLGAVVSIAQGTQVELQPAGVGVSLAPGQALQPLDQLIDQFANVMLMASVSFGIQLLLLAIGSHWVVSIAVSVAVVAFAVLSLKGRARLARSLRPTLVLLLVMRFAVPVSALGSELLYQTFMADEYRKELATISASPAAIMGLRDAELPSDEGLLGRLQRWKQRLPDLKSSYDAILAAASGWSRTIVKLIALFAVQTVVLPVGFLWMAWRLARLAVRL